MTASHHLEVPAELLEKASMSMNDVKLELAILFYQSGRISLGSSAAYAGVDIGRFLSVLADRRISPLEGPDEAVRDAAALANLHTAP